MTYFIYFAQGEIIINLPVQQIQYVKKLWNDVSNITIS